MEKETFLNKTVANYTMIYLHKKPWDPIWIMKTMETTVNRASNHLLFSKWFILFIEPEELWGHSELF